MKNQKEVLVNARKLKSLEIFFLFKREYEDPIVKNKSAFVSFDI